MDNGGRGLGASERIAMSRMLDRVRSLLEREGYVTAAVQGNELPLLLFEDVSVLGFVVEYLNLQQLLSRWSQDQAFFITRNASDLGLNPAKAWNAYSVYLTEEELDREELHSLIQIEEDFHGTRKIVKAGVRTEEDLARALAPLLRIHNVAWVEAVNLPLLLSQEAAIGSGLVSLLQEEDVDPMTILESFLLNQ
jgi:hypothetical protein